MFPLSSFRSSSPILSTLVVASSSFQQPVASLSDTVVPGAVCCPGSKTVINKSSKYTCAYLKATNTLNSFISGIDSSIDHHLSFTLKNQLMQCTLDVKDLLLASHLLKLDFVKTKASELITKCIQEISKDCVTDKDREEVLYWIQDTIKSKFNIIKYFHTDHCANIGLLIKGDLDVSLMPEPFKILCLYASRKYARKTLGKYKGKLSDNLFDSLCQFLDQTFERRTSGILSIIKHIEVRTSICCDLTQPVRNKASAPSTVDVTAVSCVESNSLTLFDSTIVKEKINMVRKIKLMSKAVKKPSSKLEDIKQQLLKGSLPLENILESRQFLVNSKIPSDQVCRWFRSYRNNIYKSTSISNEYKKKVVDEIESSKKACRSLLRGVYELDTSVVDDLEQVKSGNVNLSELKNMRMRLVKAIGSDRTSKVFLDLKKKLLDRSPEKTYEINEAFFCSKQRVVYDFSDDEKIIVQALNDGTLPLADLKQSLSRLLKIRKYDSVKVMACNYIGKAIALGAQPSQIWPNLLDNFRASDAIIMACNLEHYHVIKSLKYGSLPFSRLEEAARVAANYFTPYVLFGVLLRYVYRGRQISEEEQLSFKSLLVSLEADGLISVNKPVSSGKQPQFIVSSQTAQDLPSSVLEMFERPEEGSGEQGQIGLRLISFEDRLADMMAISGVDLELQQALELDFDESKEPCVGLLYDLDMNDGELLGAFCD